MNNAQFVNMAVTAIMALCGGAVTKLGFNPTSIGTDIGELAALIIAIFTAWKAHQFHGNNPPTASVPPNPVPPASKLGIFLIMALTSWMIIGCTTTQQEVAYTTLYGLESSATAAYSGYVSLVIKGTASTNSLPQISSGFNDFQAAMNLAITAAEFNTNALAPTALVQESSSLVNLITTAEQTK